MDFHDEPGPEAGLFFVFLFIYFIFVRDFGPLPQK